MSEEILPTPEQVEKELIDRELAAQKSLGIYAEFFHLYIHRFNNQIKFMSKKDLIRLLGSLVRSEYNDSKDVSKVLGLANKLNLNSILRSLTNVFEEGLERTKEEIKQFSKDEEAFFNLFNALYSNKYIKAIQNVDHNVPPKTIDDVLKPPHEMKEFNKRKKVEKDAYATANMLLYTKAMMVNYTVVEYMQNNDLEGKENGTKKD
jgi:hypothetical protein